MTKKVRVLKEMPWLNSLSVGTEIPVSGAYLDLFNTLVHLGYFKWVEKEKSLEEKFKEVLHGIIRGPDGQTPYFWTVKSSMESLAQIAKEHYEKKFDEAVEKEQT